MTTRNALRQAIATGHTREVKSLLDDPVYLQALKQCLQIPDAQLREHLERLLAEIGQAPEASHLTCSNSTSKTSV